jgi:hypothetical protein
MSRWVATLRSRGLAVQSGVLAAAVLVVFAAVAPAAVCASGTAGLAASATAAGLCLVGAASALATCRALRGPDYMVYGVLLGMLLRMGIPLVSAVALQIAVRPLADAYVLVYLLVFYPVTLSVETFLSLPSPNVAV